VHVALAGAGHKERLARAHVLELLDSLLDHRVAPMTHGLALGRPGHRNTLIDGEAADVDLVDHSSSSSSSSCSLGWGSVGLGSCSPPSWLASVPSRSWMASATRRLNERRASSSSSSTST